MSTNHTVSRRRFLTQSAAVGAIGCVSGVSAESSAAYQGGEDALVAPHYRGFLRKHVKDLPTPALLIDLDIMERNIQALASYMKGRPVTFRPHGKAHKSPAIGKLQLAAGAKGLCAAKLGEADVLIRGGIKDVLITAEVVGRLKIERLMALLAITPDVKAVVDSEQNVVDLSTAALASKRKLKVAIDCNVGQNRTGLGTPEEVVALAQVIAKQKGLELVGLQGYGGNNQHVKGFANRRRVKCSRTNGSWRHARRSRRPASRCSWSASAAPAATTSTPSFRASPRSSPGRSCSWTRTTTRSAAATRPSSPSSATRCRCVTTVISRATAGRAIVDAGGKALSTDEAAPEPVDLTGATYRRRRRRVRRAAAAEPQPRAQGRRSGPDPAGPLRHDGESPQRLLRRAQGHRRTRLADRGTRADRLNGDYWLGRTPWPVPRSLIANRRILESSNRAQDSASQ